MGIGEPAGRAGREVWKSSGEPRVLGVSSGRVDRRHNGDCDMIAKGKNRFSSYRGTGSSRDLPHRAFSV